TLPDRVAIKNAVGAPHGPARSRRIGETKSRRPIVSIRMDERAVERTSVLGELHRTCRRIEVRETILSLYRRRAVLASQAKVEREFRRDLEIILNKDEVHALALVDQRQRGQR